MVIPYYINIIHPLNAQLLRNVSPVFDKGLLYMGYK
jgi:hypothetical protein